MLQKGESVRGVTDRFEWAGSVRKGIGLTVIGVLVGMGGGGWW